MKRILLVTALLSLSFAILGSCSKAASIVASNCDVKAKAVTDASTAFLSDPTNKVKCQAYVSAINDMLKACPTFYSATAKKSLDDFVATACK
jgi:hypothetical protein